MTPARLDQILDELARAAPPAGVPLAVAWDDAVRSLRAYRDYERWMSDGDDVGRLTERRDSLAARREAATNEHELADYDRWIGFLDRRIARLTAAE